MSNELLNTAKSIARHLEAIAARSGSASSERLMDVANEVMVNQTSQFSALCAALRGAIAATTPSDSVTTSALGTSYVQLNSGGCDFLRGDNRTGTNLLFRQVGTDVIQRFVAGAHVWIDCTANADEWEVIREDNGTDPVTFDYLLYDNSSSMGDLSAIVTALEAVEDAILLANTTLGTINTTVTALTRGASVGDGSVTTDATGTAYVALTSASALQITATNNTGASLTFKRTGGSAEFIILDSETVDLPCTANADEWEVKRTDDSVTQVTFGYIRRF